MPRKAHYVLSTHWDREWYQPFQVYRARLVQLLDRVLEGWQREDLRGPFQTDGQAVILDDYLEVRPEMEGQLHQLVKEGRFVVGPWYVLPDEFLVSGESLIRNLELGRATARRYGGQPSSAGFLCDMFGHNSQMPQILAGFGIRGGFLWRGINLIDQHLFRWRGADGTELVSYRFGKVGYCSFAGQVRGAFPNKPEPTPAELEQRLNAFLEEENQKTAAGPLLLFDGGDHMEWDPLAYAVLAQRLDQPGDAFTIVHSSLEAYLDGLSAADTSELPVVTGELREPARYPGGVDEQWLIPGVTSSRVRIKQANARCQDLLCQWAEPFSAAASAMLGREYPQGYLDVAWRWLLQNHPHDSICGCSIDSVHEDMVYRFHQCEEIGELLTLDAQRRLAASVEGELEPNALRVVVFNPLPRPFDGVADLDLETPTGWPMFHESMGTFEPLPAFRIFDAHGQEVPYQRTAQAANRARFKTFDWRFPQGYSVNVVSVSLPLHIPALGYTTLLVKPPEANEPTRYTTRPFLAVSASSMENAALKVDLQPDGTLNVLHKASGQVYSRLLLLEDRADIGDGWNYGPAANDEVVYSSGAAGQVALVANGPQRATFRLRKWMELPQEFGFDDLMQRSPRTTRIQIDSYVTLRAGADWVEVETVVDNTVKDHRLRVLFPSGAQEAQTCLMDTPFDVVERPIQLRADNDLYREAEVETRPQQSFSAVFDRRRGLAVVSQGLLECAVLDEPERTLALTLFRATQKTVMTNGEPGGQMQGELRFRYWIVPLQGEPERARLFDLAQQLSGGLRAAQLTAADAARYRADALLPPHASFLRVEGGAVLTSLRHNAGALEARLFNPNTHSVEITLDCSEREENASLPEQAAAVDFEGHPTGASYALRDGKLTLALRAKEIRTLRLW